MKRMIALLLVGLVLVAGAAVAQDATPEPGCTEEEWTERFGDISGVLENRDPAASNADQYLSMLIIEAAVQTARWACGHPAFTSEEYPTGIIGPLIFAGTLYEATLEADGAAAARMVVIAGDCGFDTSIDVDADDDGETDLLRFDQCVAMFEVNTYGANSWSLSIKRLAG